MSKIKASIEFSLIKDDVELFIDAGADSRVFQLASTEVQRRKHRNLSLDELFRTVARGEAERLIGNSGFQGKGGKFGWTAGRDGAWSTNLERKNRK